MRDYFYIVVPLPPYYILIFFLKLEILARPSSAPHLKWGEICTILSIIKMIEIHKTDLKQKLPS